MAESVQLAVQPRNGAGSQATKRLRKQGLIPAVVYGHKEATLAVALAQDDFVKAPPPRRPRRRSARPTAARKGRLIRDVQWDHLGQGRAARRFPPRVRRRAHHGHACRSSCAASPPASTAGGVLDQPLHIIDVECLAIAVPESIRVNIGELQIGGAIHVRDLHLPEGVKAMADPDAIVVQVTAPQVEAEAAGCAPAAETAEPEVIGRKAKAEEGEEEK